MPKVTEAKKQVLLRVPERLYEILLQKSTEKTLQRGAPVTVQTLITEQLECWLENEGEDNG
ncbi:hypothetical protein ACFQAT_28765 [Undibacterium arcticum]|uniref:CopG-like ribbon-helix-helix domain-containing protein n=1 Tax=Undibacterium arcticum TaxID=1762892 RepID=A0ABV7FB05_9BURK